MAVVLAFRNFSFMSGTLKDDWDWVVSELILNYVSSQRSCSYKTGYAMNSISHFGRDLLSFGIVALQLFWASDWYLVLDCLWILSIREVEAPYGKFSILFHVDRYLYQMEEAVGANLSEDHCMVNGLVFNKYCIDCCLSVCGMCIHIRVQVCMGKLVCTSACACVCLSSVYVFVSACACLSVYVCIQVFILVYLYAWAWGYICLLCFVFCVFLCVCVYICVRVHGFSFCKASD